MSRTRARPDPRFTPSLNHAFARLLFARETPEGVTRGARVDRVRSRGGETRHPLGTDPLSKAKMVKIVELDETETVGLASAGIGLAGSELPSKRKRKSAASPGSPRRARGDGERDGDGGIVPGDGIPRDGPPGETFRAAFRESGHDRRERERVSRWRGGDDRDEPKKNTSPDRPRRRSS